MHNSPGDLRPRGSIRGCGSGCLLLLLVNYCFPPPFQVQILYDILAKVAQFASLPIVLLCDFNAVLDATLDQFEQNG